MSASARRTAWLGLLLVAGPASAGEAARLDLSQFLTPAATARPLRLTTRSAGLDASDLARQRTEEAAFEPDFSRLREVWMRPRASPPLVFREPFPHRRPVQDRLGDGVALVIRSTAP